MTRPRSHRRAIRAVIFDCDGVLFESRAANIAYHNAILGQLGEPPLTPEEENLCHILSTRELYAVRFPSNTPAVEEAVCVARGTDYSPFHALMQPVAGLRSILAGLKLSYRLAVASNRGLSLKGVLRHFKLEPYFELTVGTTDVERPKPHPDLLLRCLSGLGIKPEETVYVGDTVTDRLAAEAAGTAFVGVKEESGAGTRVDCLDKLPAVVARLANR